MRCRFILLLLQLYLPCALAQQSFYIANGRSVPLAPSTTYKSFEVAPGAMEKFIKVWVGNDVVEVERLPVSEGEPYRVVTLRRRAADEHPPGDFEEEIKKVLQGLSAQPIVIREVPVYRLDGVELHLVNRFLLRFRKGVNPVTATAFIKEELQARIIEVDAGHNRYTVAFPRSIELVVALEKINAINELPDIRYAEPLFVRTHPPRPLPPPKLTAEQMEQAYFPSSALTLSGLSDCGGVGVASSTPNDNLFPLQWSLKNTGDNPLPGYVGADINWELLYGGSEVIIAVIDIGVDMQHPDLQGRLGVGDDMTQQGSAANVHDYDYHGTAVAGLAVANTHNSKGIAGVSRIGKVESIRIGESSCESCTWQVSGGAMAAAILRSVSMGAKVLINAWYSAGPSSDFTAAVEDAVGNDVLIVYAAGNHSAYWNNNLNKMDADTSVAWPANDAADAGTDAVKAATITVSATNHKDQLLTSQYGESNCVFPQGNPSTFTCADCMGGPSEYNDELSVYTGSNHGSETDLAAPGALICSTYPLAQYRYFGDTSAAAALVGGAAAALFSLHPTAKPAEVKSWLQLKAKDLCPLGDDEYTGAGRLDLGAALLAAKISVALEVESANQRIKQHETRIVRAVVTRQGMPVRGVPVTFKKTGGLLLSAPSAMVSDSQGIVETTIEGNRWFCSTEEVVAYADDGKVTQVVKVPTLPVWWISIFLFVLVSVRPAPGGGR